MLWGCLRLVGWIRIRIIQKTSRIDRFYYVALWPRDAFACHVVGCELSFSRRWSRPCAKYEMNCPCSNSNYKVIIVYKIGAFHGCEYSYDGNENDSLPVHRTFSYSVTCVKLLRPLPFLFHPLRLGFRQCVLAITFSFPNSLFVPVFRRLYLTRTESDKTSLQASS
jgi:hypothetical protein